MQQPQKTKDLDWGFTKQMPYDGGVEHQGGETLFAEGLNLNNVTDLVVTEQICNSIGCIAFLL